MIAALLVPLVAVSLGAAMALLGGASPRVLLPVRGFALAAVVTSVATHLVPEAMTAAGVWVLAAFAAGLWLPHLLARSRRGGDARTRHRRLASELGFIAVLVHQVGDGIALGALGTGAHRDHSHWDVLLGILAHTVPLAAVVTLPFVERGARQVLLRASLLVAASGVGVLGASWLGTMHADVLPWFSAAVAGTLLHILAHDEPSLPRPAGLRAAEVLAILVGAALPAVLSGEEALPVLPALSELTVALAPVLALGLAAAMLLRGLAPQLARLPAGRGVLAGLAAAVRSPSCACEVAERAGLVGHGDLARPSPRQLAFLLAAPELHVGTLLLTAALFGWAWAAVRAALALALAAGLALLLAPHRAAAGAADRGAPAEHLPWRDQIAETLVHAGPWLAAGLVVASWFAVTTPAGWLTGAPVQALGVTGLALVIAAVAALSYVCAWAATPLAAVLVSKGLPPELAIAGLLVGSLTNREGLTALAAGLGRRLYLAIGGVALAVALLAALAAGAGPALAPLPAAPRALGLAAAALLGAGALLSLWRYGLSAWLEPLLTDAAGHQHHQHAETEPCGDGCHDPHAPAPPEFPHAHAPHPPDSHAPDDHHHHAHHDHHH